MEQRSTCTFFFRLGNSSTSLSSLIEKTDKVIFNIEVNGESCDIASASPLPSGYIFPLCLHLLSIRLSHHLTASS